MFRDLVYRVLRELSQGQNDHLCTVARRNPDATVHLFDVIRRLTSGGAVCKDHFYEIWVAEY